MGGVGGVVGGDLGLRVEGLDKGNCGGSLGRVLQPYSPKP